MTEPQPTEPPQHGAPPDDSPAGWRAAFRAGAFAHAPTTGKAAGFVQANLVILPHDYAFDFLRFCQANPVPCPLLAVSEPGDPGFPTLGADIDVRRDLPGYRVFRDGRETATPNDVSDLWRDDLVAFAIGCSFSFEEALIVAGLEVRHIAEGRNVAMYRTNRPTVPAGAFSGPMVVSMRPFPPAEAIRAIQVTSRFPTVHGAPVHVGLPEELGIADLDRPDFGDAPTLREGELPLFWGCGVTPQVALEAAKPPLAITHKPGSMLITDRRNAELAVF